MRRFLGLLAFCACGGRVDDAPPDGGAHVVDASVDRVTDAAADRSLIDVMPASCVPTFGTLAFMPALMAPPSGAHQNQCTTAQLDLYHQCVNQQQMPACSQIQQQAMTAFKTCLSCLESSTSDATWGPLVCETAMTCWLNVGGCVNLATGQSGPTSCGQRLSSLNQCQRGACAMYEMDPNCFAKCIAQAPSTVCKQYGDAYAFSCSGLTNADLVNCFQQKGEMDTKPLRIRLDTYLCGP